LFLGHLEKKHKFVAKRPRLGSNNSITKYPQSFLYYRKINKQRQCKVQRQIEKKREERKVDKKICKQSEADSEKGKGGTNMGLMREFAISFLVPD
jgi:hypothetical protein